MEVSVTLTIGDRGWRAKRARDGRVFTFFFAFWAAPELLTRLRLLITSVLRLIGRGLPWSLRKRPQALQRTEPISSRRHRGVVEVVQFWQVGWERSRSGLAAIVAMICSEVIEGECFVVVNELIEGEGG